MLGRSSYRTLKWLLSYAEHLQRDLMSSQHLRTGLHGKKGEQAIYGLLSVSCFSPLVCQR